MRLFVAVDLPEAFKIRAQELTQALSRTIPAKDSIKIKWVHPSQFHITLRFLGECEEASLPRLRQALDQVAARQNSFSVRLEHLDSFPSRGTPHVICLGVTEGMDRLKDLAGRIEAAWGVDENRSFHAHLTLGRVKSAAGGILIRSCLQKHSPHPLGTFPVEAVTLYQSVLSPAGPTYTSLHTACFSKR